MTTTRFEYETMDCADIDELNAMGADGWELIGMVDVMMPDSETESSARPMLVFKRAIQAEAAVA